MSNASTEYLAGLLERMELFSPAQVVELIEAARESEMSVTEIVAAEGYAPEEAFLEKLAEVMRLPYVRLNTREIEQDVLDRLPTKAVFQYRVIPVEFENGALLVAANDPLDAGLVDSLRLAAGGRVKLALSPSTDIAKAAKRFYGVGAETVDRMMQDDRFEVAVDDSLAKVDVTELDQEASIVKFVNQIIWEAVQQGSTDIHMEPMEEQLRIRYRVDGVLHQAPVPARLIRFQAAIISRIKVMANLDIAEKRLPMDGRIGLRVQGEDIDIRVSTMPTVYGESVSLRLLQRKGEFISLEDLGMMPRDQELVERCIHRPNGIVLVTGPTGSGKSTTLYAFLHEINKIDRRILTAEEPIEYEMGGINQVLVRPDIGLTFARTLRSFLRQDPDIIMVGEIRDAETAEIAIQASLTGHLVFSTLHTNDAAGSFTRLLDMGVEPFLVASAVAGVVAQRLVRRLCPDCRRAQTPDMARLERIAFPLDQLASHTVYEPSTCEACRMTGFRGRGGIFEVLQVSEAIESLVVARSSSHDIRQQATSEGMMTLRDDGWQKVLKGFTTIEEVLRVTEENLVEEPTDEQSKDEHSNNRTTNGEVVT
ncbi:MAG: type II/IV secretion system protein [Verrucomicrobia bacterium]|jgi:type II secretion system protein E|nr:type II/IV secretion system protein [Verrucomicrobiota bacterium]MBT7065488.1 type II/IV secretion system protein [Verrucomicrobiota bacterium]MBT7699372.1 type II/IV secretion system protein [Verrucomicrobiota bacterium]